MSYSFATPWTVACLAPLSMGFSRQEYWSGLSFPSPGDHLDPGIEPMSPALQADFLPLSHWVSRQQISMPLTKTKTPKQEYAHGSSVSLDRNLPQLPK